MAIQASLLQARRRHPSNTTPSFFANQRSSVSPERRIFSPICGSFVCAWIVSIAWVCSLAGDGVFAGAYRRAGFLDFVIEAVLVPVQIASPRVITFTTVCHGGTPSLVSIERSSVSTSGCGRRPLSSTPTCDATPTWWLRAIIAGCQVSDGGFDGDRFRVFYPVRRTVSHTVPGSPDRTHISDALALTV